MNRYEKAGRLDRRISIQRATVTTDAYGAPVETWATIATVWANVRFPLTGSDETQVDEIHLATTSTVFTIRHRQILHTDRIVWNSEEYDITRITATAGPGKAGGANHERNAFLALTAEKRIWPRNTFSETSTSL